MSSKNAKRIDFLAEKIFFICEKLLSKSKLESSNINLISSLVKVYLKIDKVERENNKKTVNASNNSRKKDEEIIANF